MESKPWYTSKLLWIGVGTSILGLLQTVVDSGVLPSNLVGPVVALIGVVTTLVRVFGSSPLSGGK